MSWWLTSPYWCLLVVIHPVLLAGHGRIWHGHRAVDKGWWFTPTIVLTLLLVKIIWWLTSTSSGKHFELITIHQFRIHLHRIWQINTNQYSYGTVVRFRSLLELQIKGQTTTDPREPCAVTANRRGLHTSFVVLHVVLAALVKVTPVKIAGNKRWTDVAPTIMVPL